jgi:hypothetical protein
LSNDGRNGHKMVTMVGKRDRIVVPLIVDRRFLKAFPSTASVNLSPVRLLPFSKEDIPWEGKEVSADKRPLWGKNDMWAWEIWVLGPAPRESVTCSRRREVGKGIELW